MLIRLTSFGSTLAKLEMNSSVPSVMLLSIIRICTSMTASPLGGKVKFCEIPVKSARSIEETNVFQQEGSDM